MRRYNPKYLEETPADKQLRQVLISMIASIILCICCLAGTTWAWFQTSLTSENNVITMGEMRVAVTLRKGDQSRRSSLVATDLYTYQLKEVGSYDIVLINNGSIPGYCDIMLTDANGDYAIFTSGTLNPAEEGLEDAATVTIEITPEDNFNNILPVTLEITPHWGEDPNQALMEVDEKLFAPTEETLPEETEPAEPTEPAETTQPTEAPAEETEPATEPTETTQSTEATEPTEETEATEVTEATESTEPAAQGEGTEEVAAAQLETEETTVPTETTE